jgi:hypothetical protein
MNFGFGTAGGLSPHDLDAVFQFTVPWCFKATNFYEEVAEL